MVPSVKLQSLNCRAIDKSWNYSSVGPLPAFLKHFPHSEVRTMASSTFTLPTLLPIAPKSSYPILLTFSSIRQPSFNVSPKFPSSISTQFSVSNPKSFDEQEEDGDHVQDLRVPENWLLPSKALQESEWLRVTLHKWLDEEYCPEATNIEISSVAARSYYESLVAKQGDLGLILLKMARDLESVSYQESFHGAFSSANAAIHLITRRIEEE